MPGWRAALPAWGGSLSRAPLPVPRDMGHEEHGTPPRQCSPQAPMGCMGVMQWGQQRHCRWEGIPWAEAELLQWGPTFAPCSLAMPLARPGHRCARGGSCR